MTKMKALATLLMCIVIASHFGNLHFSLDLLSHFRVQFAAVFVLFAAFFALGRQATWFALSIIVAAANIIPIITWYTSGNDWDKTGPAKSINVLISNVSLRNRNYQRLSQLVDRVQPDILGLMEVNTEWLENLETVLEQYEFRIEHPRENPEGLALYSKMPVTQSKSVLFGKSVKPAIVATIEATEGEFEVILAHLPWPLGADSSAQRNSQLQEMASYVRATDKQVLLLADLNTTMWSPHYREFEKKSGLTNARAGYGIGATFPSIPVISIPIDHILMTSPSKIGIFKVHESVGSDHLPISASIRLGISQPAELENSLQVD